MQAFTPLLPVSQGRPCAPNASSFACRSKRQLVPTFSRSRPRSHVQTTRAIAVDPPSLGDSIQEAVQEGKLRVAIGRVEDAISRQTDPRTPVVSYHYLHGLLYRASRSRDWDVALRTFYAMESTGLYCVRSTSWHLFSVLSSAGRVAEAERALSLLWKPFITLYDGSQRNLGEKQIERRNPDEKMVTAVAKSAVDVGRQDVATKVIQEMDNHGVPFTKYTISVLIKAHGRLGSAESVTQVLDGLSDRGIEPDLIVFNTAIDAYLRCGEKGLARQVLREITHRGLSPNATSFNPILREVARSGKIEDALALREEMELRHVKPSPYTYNHLIHACVTAKRWSLATEFLIQSSEAADRTRRYSLSEPRHGSDAGVDSELSAGAMSKDVAVGFTTVISGLALDGEIGKAAKLLDHMVKRIERSGKTRKLEVEIGIAVTAILSALLGHGDVVRAWRLFRSIRKRFNIRIPPDTYNAVIRGFARRGDAISMEAAEKVFNEMLLVFQATPRVDSKEEKGEGIGVPLPHSSPNNAATVATAADITLAHNTLIDGYCSLGRTATGERLLESMEAQGYVTTVVTYTTLINGYGKEMDVVSTRRMFRRMRERGIRPDRVTMNAFIGGCVRAGDMGLATRLFEEMQRIGGRVSPNLVTFSAMIAGHVRQSQSGEAWELYEEMKGVGIAPNERLLDRMMAAFVAPEVRPGRGDVGVGDEGEEDEGEIEVEPERVIEVEVERERLLEEVARSGVVEKGGWTMERAMVLLEDMEACKCSEMNKQRWRKAINSIWAV